MPHGRRQLWRGALLSLSIGAGAPPALVFSATFVFDEFAVVGDAWIRLARWLVASVTFMLMAAIVDGWPEESEPKPVVD